VQSAGLAILGDAQRFTVLPGEIEAALRNRVNAATVRGTFEVANATGAQLLASRFEGKPAFVIRTARFPRGELIGELQRVN
jgi:hypothetical protein